MEIKLLLSRFNAYVLQLYNALFGTLPLRNAPYGSCDTSPDAFSWLPEKTVTQNCIDHNNTARCWYTYTPLSVLEGQEKGNLTKLPLIVHLHGAGGCASLPSVGWGSLAEENNFIVIWPQGTVHPLPFEVPAFVSSFADFDTPSWNDGSGLFGAEYAGIDDMGFLETLVKMELDTNSLQLDPSKVYFSGHSNGAVMAQRFALQRSGIAAGVVAISGAGMPNDPEWSPGGNVGDNYSPVPIIFVAGTNDQQVPFYERRGPLAGAIPSIRGWASLNNCTTPDDPIIQEELNYVRHSYNDCNNSSDVVLLEIPGAGHHPFNKGKGLFQISPVNVIAECTFRGIPFFDEEDCQLIDVDTTKLAWDFISSF